MMKKVEMKTLLLFAPGSSISTNIFNSEINGAPVLSYIAILKTYISLR